MRNIRATVKAIAFCVLTAGAYMCWISGLAFVFACSGASRRWRHYCFRSWARAAAALIGIRLEMRGLPPRAPFFLVANHLSYVDIIVLASQIDCLFIAKSEVASWPVIGSLCRSLDTIFIDRCRRRDILRVNALIEEAMRQGRSIMLFPEGTTTSGKVVTPFKAGLLEPAIKSRHPVAYASLSYGVPPGEMPASLSVCWWGEMTFPDHLFGLFRLPEFRARLAFGPAPLIAPDRKALARILRAAVEEQFIPVSAVEGERGAGYGAQAYAEHG
jgi:1-acyl-sn-glycerol-3-phosphate acyltransferase